MVEMQIETIPLDPALDGIVKNIVLRRSPHSNEEYRVLIPSNMGIIACYFEDAIVEREEGNTRILDTPSLFGLQTRPRFFQDSQPYEAVLIYLTPYGLAAMLNKETPKAVDRTQIKPEILSSWFKPWGLKDKDFLSLSLFEKGQAIQHKLLEFFQQKSAPPVLKKAVEKIEAKQGNISIKELCEELNLTRQGLAYFGKRYMGISLKVYTRIERLNYALSLIEEGEGWEEIIHKCGFFDYSHLTKEIKAFTGMKVAEVKLLLTMDKSEITRFFKKQVNCHFFYLSNTPN